MKKIVLAAVNAKYIHSNLAVYDLRAYAKSRGIPTTLREYTINQNKDEILKGIYMEQPDVLALSVYIWNVSYIRELICELHKILPDMAIWLGGPEVSFDSEKVLEENPAVTGVMRGEGEKTFAELAAACQEDREVFGEIRGITYRTAEGEIRKTPDREIMDLSEVPFPYADLESFANRIIYYESSRGCPFSCSYCLSSVDKRLRFRDLELVKQELQFFIDHEVKQVKFVDRTFNCKKEHAMAIWSYLIAHDRGITNFHFEIAADLITEEELQLFTKMRPGLIQLEIGVQSVNPHTIEEIHRKMDYAQVCDIVRAVQKGRNIHQHLDLIAGLPYEDYASFAHSFDCVYALHPQQLQLGFLKVLKGSYMYEHVDAYACVYQSKEPYEVLSTRWLSYADVLRLKQVEEMVEVYYNSTQFGKTLEEIEKHQSSMFVFFEALGDFYEARGYFAVSHTRMRRYEILLEFLREQDPQRMAAYTACAVWDVYARENAKSRPVFAGDQSRWKDQIRSFYQWEEENRKVLSGYESYNWKQMQKMTHLEVWELPAAQETKVKAAERNYETESADADVAGSGHVRAVLFDYLHRDPLTQDARMVDVSTMLMQEESREAAGKMESE